MHRFIPSWTNALTFVAGIVVGLFAAGLWNSSSRQSSLTKDLAAKASVASSQFDRRLRARFPLGTRTSDMVIQLAAEGFEPSWFDENGEKVAVLNDFAFPCNNTARVYWRAGRNDALAAIRGVYQEEACL